MKLAGFVTLFSAVLAVLVVANPYARVLAEQSGARRGAYPNADPGTPAQTFVAAGEPGNAPALPLKFKSVKLYLTGSSDNYGIAVADLNGDGRPDLVVSGFDSSSSSTFVGVLLGNGDGTFGAPTTYNTGGSIAYSVAIADVDGDGHPDLVVANQGTSDHNGEGNVGVLLGNGDGTFRPVVNYDSGGSGALSIAIADVNGDGHPDLVVANQCSAECGGTGLVGVLLNNGSGSFMGAVTYSSGASLADSVAVGDFDGDGKPDIVVAHKCNVDGTCNTENGSLGVMLNNGDGTFKPRVMYSAGGYMYALAVAVADMNGDGKLDLIVGNWCQSITVCGGFSPTGGVSVLLGNGNGTFQLPVTYAAGTTNAGSTAVRDVNGDGHPDVLVPGGTNVDVLLGNGDGTLQAPQGFYARTTTTGAVAIADLDGDGRPDLLSADRFSQVSVLLNALRESATTAVTSSANPALINQPVTFTATITSTSPVPDGTIITFSDPTVLGTATTKNGVASVTTSFAAAKTYSIHGSFPGDPFHGKSSAYLTGGEVVTLYSSTTTLTSSPNPSNSGQAVTLTAKVTSGAPGGPTGKVTFKNGATVLGASTLSAGTATLTTTRLPVGTLTITANYRGDTQSATSSGTTSQTVN